MSISTSTPSWFGWLWTGESWERVCKGDSLSACHRRLSVECRRRNVADKYAVMTGGGPPTFVPADATQSVLCDAKGYSNEDDL